MSMRSLAHCILLTGTQGYSLPRAVFRIVWDYRQCHALYARHGASPVRRAHMVRSSRHVQRVLYFPLKNTAPGRPGRGEVCPGWQGGKDLGQGGQKPN